MWSIFLMMVTVLGWKSFSFFCLFKKIISISQWRREEDSETVHWNVKEWKITEDLLISNWNSRIHLGIAVCSSLVLKIFRKLFNMVSIQLFGWVSCTIEWTEFFRNTQSWEYWHICSTLNENKFEIVARWINFNATLHLLWYFELKLMWLMTASGLLSNLGQNAKVANLLYYGKARTPVVFQSRLRVSPPQGTELNWVTFKRISFGLWFTRVFHKACTIQ